MAMDAKQLKELIIVPAIKEIDLYSEAAANLLLGTSAHETHLGTYLKQLKGIALGVYQMEPTTHQDVWNYITPSNRGFLFKIIGREHASADHNRLVYDLKYATQIARIHYYRIPESLPDKDDVLGLAAYWKRYWNTSMGKGSIEDFVENYRRYVSC